MPSRPGNHIPWKGAKDTLLTRVMVRKAPEMLELSMAVLL